MERTRNPRGTGPQIGLGYQVSAGRRISHPVPNRVCDDRPGT
jgi:hypothetical protein